MKRTMIWLVILTMLVTALPGTLPAAHANDAHTHQWSQWYTEYSATCVDSGYEYRYCEQCYTYEYRNYPPALGHNFQFVVRDQPSCTKQGYGIDICTRCGATRDNGRPIDALGHNYQRTVAQEPTCTSSGTAVYTCSRCGDAYREPIPAGNHKWGPWQPGDPATCVQHGTRYHDCTRCGAREWERDYTTDLGDHDWGEWVTVKEPTATEPGLEERTCKVDASHKEQREVPPMGDVPPATLPAADGEKINPSLSYTATWADDAGVGKRYEGAIVYNDDILTNTGNCDLYIVYSTGFVSQCESVEAPHPLGDGLKPDMYRLAPGETIIFHGYRNAVWKVSVESGVKEFTTCVEGCYENEDGNWKKILSNKDTVQIPLTYPDGVTPEEDKPGIKLTVVQNGAAKEAYADADHFISENGLRYFVTVSNIGNVPLRVKWVSTQGADGHLGVDKAGVLNPGKSYTIGCSDWITNQYGYLPSANDAYMGVYPIAFTAYGYAVDDTEYATPLCEDGPVNFSYNIAKSGPAEWEIPEESQMEMWVYTYAVGQPSDPAGYQLGEYWYLNAVAVNKGTVDIDQPLLHVDYEIDECWHPITMSGITQTETWIERVYPDTVIPTKRGLFGVHGHITEEDVKRGYVYASGYVKWTDPESGNERKAYSNVWQVPVISKTGLLLNKGYKDPANGEYFEEGEQIEWTLSMKNNSKEPIKDITVKDNGATIGMFAEVTPEQGEIKLGVPKYTVTEYDAKVVGKVTNIASAIGTDLKGVEHNYSSNPAIAKAGNKAPDPNDGDGGGGTDPLGPIYGYDIAVSIIKAEAHSPAQEDWYALNENVDYTVTVKNTGKDPIENVTVYDSLNGFAPIGTVDSLAPGEERTFTFTWKVTEYNVDVMHYVVNQATVTYTFGGGISGTPMKSNKVYVKAGENGFIPEDGIIDPDGDPDGHFDPGLLHGEGDDCCAMTLLHTGDNEAYYQLTLCSEHAKVMADAKAAADAGDWKTAAETIRTALDEIYAKYYEAGDDSAKAAVMNERLTYYAHIGAYQTLAGDKAAAEKMALKLIQLCSMANTAPETLPDSLANGMNGLLGDNPDVTVTGRVIGLFDGGNEVTDTYAGADARALKGVKDLLKAAKSYNFDEVFERGQIIWQTALDESVNAIYKAADRETRKQIAAWRISLDNLYTGERPMLEMLYPDNDAAVEEILMNLYRDTAMDKEQVR